MRRPDVLNDEVDLRVEDEMMRWRIGLGVEEQGEDGCVVCTV